MPALDHEAKHRQDKFHTLYKALMKDDKNKVFEVLGDEINKETLLEPRQHTVNEDTLLHIAIYSDLAAQSVIEIFDKLTPDTDCVITLQNKLGDTILHEAARTNNFRLAKKLIEKNEKLLFIENIYGEIPLFKAVQQGSKHTFRCLAGEMKEKVEDVYNYLSRNNSYKKDLKDGDTILHQAILNESFEIAIKIIDQYPGLVYKKNQYNLIGLQLLSGMTSAFKSGSNYGLLERLIYCCLPDDYIDDNDDNNEIDKQDITSSVKQGSFLSFFKDMALEIINYYPNLVNRRNDYKLTGLHLLSSMTSAFPSRSNYGLLENLIYYYIGLPKDDDDNNETDKQDKSKVSSVKQGSFFSFAEGIPLVRRIQKEKRKHQYALELAKHLIKEDLSWDKDDENNIPLNELAYEFQPILKEDDYKSDEDAEKEKKGEILKFSPILVATSRGIVEIVDEILRVYPQAIDVASSIQQNILHIAIKHRHLEIFENVIKDHKMSSKRLARRIDKNGNSILHLVGNTTYAPATKLAPAFQLQEELEWYERVKKITPDQYKEFKYKNKPTPWQHFERNHQDMLITAQEWVKQTSESCSTVAVLVATVAFAAAYTVPGGSDEAGSPILIGQLFFMIFTITDVLALASSLTAVVLFLSILTSPFAITEFRTSLPYKLHIGFSFLFFSVAMTLLSFAATIILIVQLKKGWLTIAFLPVSVLAVLQIPFFLMFNNILEKVPKKIEKVPKMIKKIYTLIM